MKKRSKYEKILVMPDGNWLSHTSKAVENILADKTYKDNARKYKKILEKYNGPKMGAELIGKYLQIPEEN
ncbi:MAG: hypothetical protein AB1498_08475 [bacterium]